MTTEGWRATWLSGIARVPQIDSTADSSPPRYAGASERTDEPWLGRIRELGNVPGLSMYDDGDTNVTVVHIDVGSAIEPAGERALVDLLELSEPTWPPSAITG